MHPVLAYLLFLLALLSALLLTLQSWMAAVPLVLFAWLSGEWLALTLLRARHRRRRRDQLLREITQYMKEVRR